MDEKYSREQFAAKLGADGDPKLNAAADFAARLLNSPVGERVARIVLFGSVARGEARPESDVDVLVIGTGDLKRLQDQASETAFDLLLEGRDYISPMVYGLSDAEYPSSWFLYNTLQLGREVFCMNEKELRRRESQAWWALAKDYLQQAHGAGQQGSFRLAVDGAYNAAELAVKGLLALRVARMPTSHGGLLQILSKEYVVTGEVDRTMGQRLTEALDLRAKARYVKDAVITAEHVTQVAALAQEMIDLLEKTLSSTERQDGGDSN